MTRFPLALPAAMLGGLLFAATVSVARADVTLPSVLSANMVFQRDVPVPVWGKAAPGEEVAVSFNGQTAKTQATPDGAWQVKLSGMPAGGPFKLTVSGKNTIQVDNVLIGEVWFCSGQSNMALMLEKATNAKEEIAAANFPDIRIFNTKRTIADTPQFTVAGKWEPCSPTTAGRGSAVAYFFARKLHLDLKVPVGIVHSTWGGTAAEGWVPRAVLESDPDFKPILDRWAQDAAAYPEAKKEFDAKLPELQEKFRQEAQEARKNGTMEPHEPPEPKGAPGSRDTPAGLYNGMVTPFLPMAIRGVAWYQGEANAGRAHQYRKLFPALIGSWRKAWGQGGLPFLFVQLPNLARQPEPSRSGWAELREAQLLTWKQVPNTSMVVTIDVGDPKNLHPTNKLPVGQRLALAAEATIYGKKDLEYSGPIYRSMDVQGHVVRLAFDHVGSGLEAKGGATLGGFTVAGKDKKFSTALAEIRNGEVFVSSPEVAEPVAVRYDWADNPAGNFYNKAGLPASPFRTDDWPEVTFEKK